MAARTERDTLNGLIEICRDGARGFQLAADHVADPELKRLFNETSRQRNLFAAELLPYAQRLGGDNDAAGTAKGALHRSWMRFKDAVSGYDERMVLEEAQRGEAAAIDTYKDAISSLLPPNARPVIERQYGAIRNTQRELFEISLPCS
ncbi:MAG TPA: PA2169 family four-helix-bundle protein [Vicinamibacterales bacterium]